MKFKNHYLKLVTEGRTAGWTSQKQYAPSTFQSWGHTKSYLENSVDQVQMVPEN